MTIEIEGIVLRRVTFKEKDCMLTVLTKNGIISFNARGIMSQTSKNASSCNLFCKSIFELNDKNGKYSLKQGKLIDSHYFLYTNYEKITAVQLITEATLKFIDEDNKEIYDYFINFMNLLEKDFDTNTLICIYLAQLIKNSGYSLEYSSCVNCGKKQNIVSISYKHGGFVCNDCNSKFKLNILSMDLLNSFRYVFMIEASRMDYHIIDKEISNILINDFIHHLCNSFDVKELNSLEMYKII